MAWAVALIIEPAPWDIDVAAVLAAGLLVITAVALTAILVESSRLGYWLAVSGVGLMLVIAGVREVDPAWAVAISVTGVAGILLADRRLGGWIRAEGPVAPVPAQAAALGLILLMAPILTALSLFGDPIAPSPGWLCQRGCCSLFSCGGGRAPSRASGSGVRLWRPRELFSDGLRQQFGEP